jgi:hypothetical protein
MMLLESAQAFVILTLELVSLLTTHSQCTTEQIGQASRVLLIEQGRGVDLGYSTRPRQQGQPVRTLMLI